ncbi:MAG: 50S ribosomal protein L10 [Bdellovibrionaceae bacterium]|jgi:large subunit ribosomal protein L10|nr:50S ribosomal protein L10 [Pseudobdellovibrionaceae bacterium]
MMNRAQKAEAISNLSEKFTRAKAAYLVDYKGLNVEQVTNIRKALSPLDSEMKVVRNTLAKLAIKSVESIDDTFSDSFIGANAVVFAYEDVSSPAKAISEFTKTMEELEIKTGVMGGKILDEVKIKYLATLPGKDELRAQLLGTLAAPMTKMVRTMNEVPTGFARLLNALKDSKE